MRRPLSESELALLWEKITAARDSVAATQPNPMKPGYWMGYGHTNQEIQIKSLAAAYDLHFLWEDFGERAIAELITLRRTIKSKPNRVKGQNK